MQVVGEIPVKGWQGADLYGVPSDYQAQTGKLRNISRQDGDCPPFTGSLLEVRCQA